MEIKDFGHVCIRRFVYTYILFVYVLLMKKTVVVNGQRENKKDSMAALPMLATSEPAFP